jgi:ubiquinone/menaquinone biosynthesis C-methylase UbiE
MLRRPFTLLLSVAFSLYPVAAQLAPDNQPRQEIVVPNFDANGWILDLGGGCRGTIGRLKPDQVVAIDISPSELREAPASFLKIVMDASDLKFLDGTFRTETAFFSLMYMPPSIHRKVFAEAYRVLQPGGRWLIYASPSTCERDYLRNPFYRPVRRRLPAPRRPRAVVHW